MQGWELRRVFHLGTMRIWLPAAAFAAILNNRIALASEAVSSSSSSTAPTPPFVTGKIFINGDVNVVSANFEIADVYSCCASVDECPTESSSSKRLKIGTMPQMTTEQALTALQSAVTAWDGGSGTWSQMKLSDRITAIQTFMTELKLKREEIVITLMHEIGKNRVDAESEFDRTMQFIEKTIEYIQSSGEFGTRGWDTSNGLTRLFLSRAAVGIVLCMGPYNYPLNETYATLIPALLMGNVVILKLPTVGGLVHSLTIDAFRKALPPGTIKFISGRGRTTMPPLMESGKIDSLAFIGGSTAADRLIKAHPHPHRLKIFLQLEGKNMGIYMRDLFEKGIRTTDNENEGKDQHMGRIMKETIMGTLSYNGQRCTALKLLFVPKEYSTQFANMLAEKVENMSVGLPWERANSAYSQITPLPYAGRVLYMKELIDDAIEKGARIVNKNGGTVIGDSESTLMVPAILYPVTPDMRVYEEEQFGPVIPIAPYESLEEVIKYAREGKYGRRYPYLPRLLT